MATIYADLIDEPTGDACAILVEKSLMCDGQIIGNTIGGPSQLSNYSCSTVPGYDQSLPERVYLFIPQANGEVNFRVQSATVDADMYLLPTGCNPAECLAASETAGDDQLSFTATIGTEYYIAIETFDSPGDFELTIETGGACLEDCDNGVDDDFDGDIDCNDTDCNGDPACPISKQVFSDGFEYLE
jgi:hypothetical protein